MADTPAPGGFLDRALSWIETTGNKLPDPAVLFVIVRFGLVAATVGFYLTDLLGGIGLSGNLTVWYAPSFLIPAFATFALLAYGFHISLAGQPMFGSGRLSDP